MIASGSARCLLAPLSALAPLVVEHRLQRPSPTTDRRLAKPFGRDAAAPGWQPQRESNAYGRTEPAWDHHVLLRAAGLTRAPPRSAGARCPNTRTCYVLDDRLWKPSAVGVAGEMFIGGAVRKWGAALSGVALGLTAEQMFVRTPFRQRPNGLFIATGDFRVRLGSEGASFEFPRAGVRHDYR